MPKEVPSGLSVQLPPPAARTPLHDNENLGLCDVYHLNGQPDAGAEIAFFLSVPWCSAHLKPAKDRPPGSAARPVVHIVLPNSRRRGRPVPNADGSLTSSAETHSNFFATTLHSPDTIGAFIVFYEEPPPSPDNHLDYRAPVLELKALLRLGPGLNGHRGVVHGGMVATIFDEVLALLMPLNYRRAKHNRRVGAVAPPPPVSASTTGPEAAAAASANVHNGFVTSYLKTTYLRPVRTPGLVLVTARYARLEGARKFYVEGAIWDDRSQALAKADCLFVALKEKL
ncbi:hypothetical protein SEPCBS119000_000506 [Sporothrix epigloea]|uniref:Thioesterase domain-containing protein n=1 Tax=Sporothrix epigloea TaxID=1892477 RepID=A0ABP0D5I2_9PEZI